MADLDRDIALFMGELEKLIDWKVAEHNHGYNRKTQREAVIDAMSHHLKAMFLDVLASHSFRGPQNDDE